MAGKSGRLDDERDGVGDHRSKSCRVRIDSDIPRSSQTRPQAEDGDADEELVARRTETLGAMTAIAIHEISNVLHWLHMSVGVVERQVGSGDSSQLELEVAVRDVRLGVNHITDIVRELRDLRRPIMDAPIAFDPTDALRTALKIAARRVGERAELVEELWPVPEVCGREHELVCVFLNLLLNAAEAVPEGAAESNTVTVRALVDPAGMLLFEVEDTGRGIPTELADRIFEPYVTSRVKRGGTGLGLHVCRRIVHEMGGRIGFEPAPLRGTRFWVSLPRCNFV